ncbi:hypothetical protein M0812_30149 [Anaeramoeba flamelloides]|uniref:Uncharacterized protein n=1 Tax=Anaeramoeba flamelloides TaxID=1746091 RepID=A0AAV7Y180_9EUKA|nr:hypothetical protein M0812_30149 [Anaeramoeba flamelloides]
MFLLSNGEHNNSPKQTTLGSQKFFTRLESKTKFNKENPTPFDIPIEEYLSGESEAINFISNMIHWLIRNYRKHGIIRSTTRNSRTFYLFKGEIKIQNFQTTKCKNIYWANTKTNSNSNTERSTSESELISSDEEKDGNWNGIVFGGKQKESKINTNTNTNTDTDTDTNTNRNTNTNPISSENSENESQITSDSNTNSKKRNGSDLSSSKSKEKVSKNKNNSDTGSETNLDFDETNSGSETNSDFDDDRFQNNELEDNLYEIKYGDNEKRYFNQDLDTIIKQMDPKPTLGRQKCVYLNYLLFNTIGEWKSASHEKTLNQKCSQNLEKYDNYIQEAYEDVLLVAKMGGASFKCKISQDLNAQQTNKILKENEPKSPYRKGKEKINKDEENKKVLELEKKYLQIVDPSKLDTKNFKKTNSKTSYKSKLDTKMGFALSPNNKNIFVIRWDRKKESKYIILEFETIIEMLTALISIIFFITKKK